uniref:Uncharacterized protein n=1 Tax=Fusarium oxysporum (strain Fo5176) TaxID=660025 RepID=A0A0D2XY73_FUSOF
MSRSQGQMQRLSPVFAMWPSQPGMRLLRCNLQAKTNCARAIGSADSRGDKA